MDKKNSQQQTPHSTYNSSKVRILCKNTGQCIKEIPLEKFNGSVKLQENHIIELKKEKQ